MVPIRIPPVSPPDPPNPDLISSKTSDGSSGSETEKLPEADQQIIGCGDVGTTHKEDASADDAIKETIVFDDDDEVPVNYAQASNDQGKFKKITIALYTNTFTTLIYSIDQTHK